MFCYWGGGVVGRLEERSELGFARNVIYIIIILLASVFNSIQITIDYFMNLSFKGYIGDVYFIFTTYAHAF